MFNHAEYIMKLCRMLFYMQFMFNISFSDNRFFYYIILCIRMCT